MSKLYFKKENRGGKKGGKKSTCFWDGCLSTLEYSSPEKAPGFQLLFLAFLNRTQGTEIQQYRSCTELTHVAYPRGDQSFCTLLKMFKSDMVKYWHEGREARREGRMEKTRG